MFPHFFSAPNATVKQRRASGVVLELFVGTQFGTSRGNNQIEWAISRHKEPVSPVISLSSDIPHPLNRFFPGHGPRIAPDNG
jgi:hypothetical protein